MLNKYYVFFFIQGTRPYVHSSRLLYGANPQSIIVYFIITFAHGRTQVGGKSRCLPGSPGKQSICGTFFSLLWGGGGFSYRGPFFFIFLVPFSLCAGAFSHYVQSFFGAHALVARAIANMLLWQNLRQMVIHNLLISVNTFWSTF